jgi:hypothetical protein
MFSLIFRRNFVPPRRLAAQNPAVDRRRLGHTLPEGQPARFGSWGVGQPRVDTPAVGRVGTPAVGSLQAVVGNFRAMVGNLRAGLDNLRAGVDNLPAGPGNLRAGLGNFRAGPGNLRARHILLAFQSPVVGNFRLGDTILAVVRPGRLGVGSPRRQDILLAHRTPDWADSRRSRRRLDSP